MKTLVMILTYNEKENIKELISAILNLNIPSLEIVVVDDNSPDGTWKIVKDISKKEPKVHLLLRTKDKGRGIAGVAGFKYCLENGADYIIEMDADFSHDPVYIPIMLKEIKKYDVVIGSRSVEGGKEKGRILFRRIITKLANDYIRLILGLKVKDCNSGYRCFRRGVLEKINLDAVKSIGPAVVQEILYRVHLNRFKIKETPIIFKERLRGSTTKVTADFIIGYFMIIKFKIDHLMGKI